MTVAAVMLVKDEIDVIGWTVRHLLQQVDHLIVSDNMSTDGTAELLLSVLEEERGPGEGTMDVIDDEEPGYYQSAKTSVLARHAWLCGHAWVLPCDADEYWYSPHGRIADVLTEIQVKLPTVLPAPILNHLATGADDPGERSPFRRLHWRSREPLGLHKVACTTGPGLVIEQGNHGAHYEGAPRARMLDILELRHYPYRSPEQFVTKAVNGAAAYAASDLPEDMGSHWRMYGAMIAEHGEQAGRDWFHEHFYSAHPNLRDDLVYDPAPGA